VVALVVDKNLGLVFKTAKGLAVYDAVAVALKGCAKGVFGLLVAASPA
jgi:hypothetical protein